jgi:hypothetical protein
MMQFTRADPRLAQPYETDVLRDLFTLPMAQISNTVAFVVSLATDGEKLASPDDGQPLDLFLREDLPGRFFTIETP